jgi:hypothetical protein
MANLKIDFNITKRSVKVSNEGIAIYINNPNGKEELNNAVV